MKISARQLKRVTIAIAVAAIFTATCAAEAAIINQVIDGTTYIDPTVQGFSQSSVTRTAAMTADGSGLNTTTGFHDTSATGNAWDTTAFTEGELQFIEFDLGGVVTIDSARIWNNGGFADGSGDIPTDGNRGAQDIEILVAATDGGAFSSVGTFTLARVFGGGTFGETFSFAAVDAHDVRIEITSNYVVEGGSPSFDRTGLSEVRFAEFVPIPEPTAMLLAAMGLVALAARWRRRRER